MHQHRFEKKRLNNILLAQGKINYWTLLRFLAIAIMIIAPFAMMAVQKMRVSELPTINVWLVAVPLFIWLNNKPKRLVYATLTCACLWPALLYDFEFPIWLESVLDILIVMALVQGIHQRKRRSVAYLAIPLVVFLLIGTFSTIVHNIGPRYYLSAIKYFFRPFALLFSAALLLDKQDTRRICLLMICIVLINIPIASYQCFVMQVGQDSTNGLFGLASGGNAISNVAMLGILSMSFCSYLSGNSTFRFPVIVGTACLYIAAISELKFFFIEFVMLFVVAIILIRPPFRKTASLTLFVIISIIVAYALFMAIYPGWSGFFTPTTMFHHAAERGYADPENNLSRLGAVHELNEKLLTNPFDSMFGLGFGSAQNTRDAISPLYYQLGTTLEWEWFTDAMIYIETGYLGLFTYIGFFIVYITWNLKQISGSASINKHYGYFGVTIAIMTFPLLVYNATMTYQFPAIMWAVFLSLPLASFQESNDCQIPQNATMR